MKSKESNLQAVFDYCLCKFCPLLIVGFLLCTSLSFVDWRLYAIAGFVVYIQHFNFKVGYSVGVCEKHGLTQEE